MLSELHECARAYRRLLPATSRVIAIAGIEGKTATKEMVAAVLSQRFAILKSGRSNSDIIGVPLNLLQLDSEQDFGVFELHSNSFGDIGKLSEILRPDVGVITRTGIAPVEFLPAEAGVAEEMATLLDSLSANGEGIAVLNADDSWHNALRRRTRALVITVGIDNPAHLRATDIKITGGITFRLNIARRPDSVVIRLKTIGYHKIYSALQAAAVGYMHGMELEEICEGLESSDDN